MIQKSNTLIDDLYRQYWKSIYGVFFLLLKEYMGNAVLKTVAGYSQLVRHGGLQFDKNVFGLLDM
jgi:hypothetical protein